MTVYLERGYNHNEELKSLTRYRFDKVKERAKLKMSISWLSCILFPELKKLGLTLHMVSVYWSYVKKKYKLNTTNFLFLCNC